MSSWYSLTLRYSRVRLPANCSRAPHESGQSFRLVAYRSHARQSYPPRELTLRIQAIPRRLLRPLAFAALVASMLALPGRGALAEDSFGAPIAAHLENLALRLDDLVTVDPLSEPLPLTEISLSSDAALRLGSLFRESLGAAVAGAASDTSLAQLISMIDGIDADLGGVHVTYDDVSGAIAGDTVSLSFSVSAVHSTTTAMVVPQPTGDLVGGELSMTFTLSSTFEFEFDSSNPDPAFNFGIVDEPVIELRASASGTIPVFRSAIGFADVDVGGTYELDYGVDLGLVDPDGDGLITVDEWTNAIPEDLTLASFTPSTAVDVELVLDSPLLGAGDDGEIRLQDSDFTDGVVEATTTLRRLNDFTNVDASVVLSGLAEFGAGLLGVQAVGDLQLPFLRERLSDGVSFIAPLAAYIREQGDAAIVCGTTDTDPPLGDVTRLLPGDTVFCQTITIDEPVSVSWNAGAGTVVSGGSDTSTVGINPTGRVEISVGAQGVRDIAVEFTDGAGEDHLVVQRFRTAQELFDGLEAVGLVGPGDLAYDPVTWALTYHITAEFDASATTTARLDFGSRLLDDTRMRGLSATDEGGGEFRPRDISVDVTFGVLLVDDVALINPGDNAEFLPNIEDRFFIGVDPSSPEFTANVDVVANLAMAGRIGFVDVSTSASSSVYSMTAVDPLSPMLEVDIAGGAIAVPGASRSNAIPVRELLADLQGSASSTVNARADIVLAASAPTDSGPIGAGTVTIAWPDVSSTSTLSVATDPAFDTTLAALDIDHADPNALRDVVLNSLVELAIGFDSVVDASFDAILPIVGVSAHDIAAGQLADVPSMVRALRAGPPIAIRCGLTDTIPPEGSATAVNPGDTIYCQGTAFKEVTSALWSVTGLAIASTSSPPILDTVGIEPTANMAWTVTDPGGQFTIRLDFGDADGSHSAFFPDPTPRSLQQLERFVEGQLGIGSDKFTVFLEDVPPAGAVLGDGVLDLIVALDYVVCTNGNSAVLGCGVGDHEVAKPAVRLILDAGELAGFAGLVGLTLDSSLLLAFVSRSELNIAVPLDGTGTFDPAEVVALDTSGVTVQVGTQSTLSGVSAALGASTVTVSGPARLSVIAGLTPTAGPTFEIDSLAAFGVLAPNFPLAAGCDGPPNDDACALLDVTVNGVTGQVPFRAPDITDPAGWTAPLPENVRTKLSEAVFDWSLLTAAVTELAEDLKKALDGTNPGRELPLVGGALDGGAGIRERIDFVALSMPLLTGILQANTDLDTTPDEIETLILEAITDSAGDEDFELGLTDLGFSIDIASASVTILCEGAACAAGDKAADIDDVRITFKLSEGTDADPAPGCTGGGCLSGAGTEFSVGVPGISLRAQGNVGVDYAWSLALDFGLSRLLGPYLGVDAPPELEIGATAELLASGPGGPCPAPPGTFSSKPGLRDHDASRCMRGELAFISTTFWDGGAGPHSENDPSVLDLATTVNITGGSGGRISYPQLVAGTNGVVTVLDADANLNLVFRTGGDGGSNPPGIAGVFSLSMTGGAITDIRYRDLYLDGGTLAEEFIGPILSNVKKVTSPLSPVVDTIVAPLPVISDLSEMVGGDPITLLSMVQATGADTTLIESLIAIIRVANSLELGDLTLIELGDGEAGFFEIDVDLALEGPPGPNQAQNLITALSFRADLLEFIGAGPDPNRAFGVPGLSMPILSDGEELYGMLLGQDAILVFYDAGTLRAAAGMSTSFGPIFIGPIPIFITLSGSISVEARFAMGYDTFGIRMAFETGSGGKLLQGIFIDDLDRAGNDVPEVRLVGEITAGAGISFAIVSAGVQGGLRLTVTMDLDDRPEPDGRLRIHEILNKLDNPICLFVTSGSLDAFLRAYVKISFVFYKKTWYFAIANVRLLDFTFACDPLEPVLAEKLPHIFPPKPENWDEQNPGVPWDPEPIGFILRLNMGPEDRRQARNILVDEIDERYVVRQLSVAASLSGVLESGDPEDPIPVSVSESSYRVAAFGISQDFDDIVEIDALMDDGNDIMSFEPGVADDGSVIPFAAPVRIDGGPGDDRITSGDGDDVLFGGPGQDTLSSGLGNDTLYGGAGSDILNGESGNDTLFGDGGPELFVDDALAGNDVLVGGPGGDTLRGGPGDDNLMGGPGTNTPGAPGSNPDLADTLFGGPGDDNLDGNFGDDLLYGDESEFCNPADSEGHDQIFGGFGNDTIVGGPGNDFLVGEQGDDEILGCGGQDLLDGDDDLRFTPDGNDTLRGGDGIDQLLGRGGDDNLFGEGGDDSPPVVTGEGAGAESGFGGLFGGRGDDNISGGLGADWIEGGKGRDFIFGDDGFAVRAPGQFNASSIEFSETVGDSDFIFGERGDDALFGEGGHDAMDGGDGADVMHGNGGNDTMRGGTDTDQMFGEAGLDNMFGDSGTDLMFGGPDSDTMRGGIGDDYMEGNGDADELWGGAGEDDMIGGSSSPAADGPDVMFGLAGHDVMLGDNGTITRPGGFPNAFDGSAKRDVTLLGGGFGNDRIFGGAENDRLFGQNGNDLIRGGGGDDFIEGNAGGDEIFGDNGQDDIIGGSSAGDGVIGSGVPATGLLDGADTIDSGAEADVVAGDNALITRPVDGAGRWMTDTASPGDIIRNVQLFDVDSTGSPASPAASGGDTIQGGVGRDLLFGQGGGDEIHAGAGDDYVEGNHGNDTIWGNAGEDDLIGGSSSGDGSIGSGTLANGLLDGADTMYGDDAVAAALKAGDSSIEDDDTGADAADAIAGDNAVITRVLGGGGAWERDPNTDAVVRSIRLFDVEIFASPAAAGTSGGDEIWGEGGCELILGGGGDDELHGGACDDHIEGNHGNDTIWGNAGEDDLIGGSSSGDGVIFSGVSPNGLLDGVDTIYGGDAVKAALRDGVPSIEDPDTGPDSSDVIAGDNAQIVRELDEAGIWRRDDGNIGQVIRSVRLFDIERVGSPAQPGTSGGDELWGEEGRELVFGQGGGDEIHAGAGDDYVEGNHGDDTIWGNAGEDDLIGGGSANDGVIFGGAPADDLLDGADTIYGDDAVTPALRDADPSIEDPDTGGDASDVIAGDNAQIVRDVDGAGVWLRDDANAGQVIRSMRLFDLDLAAAPAVPDTSGGDELWGEDGREFIFGQGGDDEIHGGAGGDYVEGNHASDTIWGNAGQDDLIGGGSASDGVIFGGAPADELLDGADTIYGDDAVTPALRDADPSIEDPDTSADASDVIAGDNAQITRLADETGEWLTDPNTAGDVVRAVHLYDVQTSGGPGFCAICSGDDEIWGEGGREFLFGQGGSDEIHGGAGDDYVEGNHAGDVIWGNAGEDDLIGGGSANDGWIDPDSDAGGLLDGADTLFGDDGETASSTPAVLVPLDPDTGADGADVTAGDNARINRLVDALGIWRREPNTGAVVREIALFDVQVIDGIAVPPTTSGGDTIWGEGSRDLMFGQGNGAEVDDDGDGRFNEDPPDGFDNDRDGRESAASVGFDCEDGEDNDGDGFADGLDADCQASVDEDPGGDEMHGGGGDDYMEGNHGGDLMFGDAGEDDMIGGSSAGRDPAVRDGAVIFGVVEPRNLLDGDDAMHGGGEDDVMIGDNGRIVRGDSQLDPWERLIGGVAPDGGEFHIVVRHVFMDGVPLAIEGDDAFGDDYMRGNDDHDDMYGQFGADVMFGDAGEDAILGDLGLITKNIVGDGKDDDGLRIDEFIRPEQPFLDDVIFVTSTLYRETELYAFLTGDPRNGGDTIIGGADGDSLHGGPGDDMLNGNGGDDRIFGGDDDDIAWGGPDHDHIYGGHGEDTLDVRPRLSATYGRGGNAVTVPKDPPEWWTYARQDHYQDWDFIYGGYDRDVMQTNDNNSGIGPIPAPPNDRLLDWVGTYNLYLICEPLYGDFMITRTLSPGMAAFLNDLALGDGAVMTAVDGTSGFREIGLVYAGADTKFNAGKAHRGTPGHFVCDDDPAPAGAASG